MMVLLCLSNFPLTRSGSFPVRSRTSASSGCARNSAGTAAACGIAFLQGADADMLGMIITNTQANVGGIVCDGAKSSCAAKIASSVEAGLLGYEMAKRGHVFRPGRVL